MTPLEEVARVADVVVRVDVEIDRLPLKLGEILALREGSVVKLLRPAGDDIDIRIGGALVGFGEVQVTGNAVGVRVTDFKREE